MHWYPETRARIYDNLDINQKTKQIENNNKKTNEHKKEIKMKAKIILKKRWNLGKITWKIKIWK